MNKYDTIKTQKWHKSKKGKSQVLTNPKVPYRRVPEYFSAQPMRIKLFDTYNLLQYDRMIRNDPFSQLKLISQIMKMLDQKLSQLTGIMVLESL